MDRAQINQSRLVDLVDPRTIQVNLSASDWSHATDLVGNILVEAGLVETEYVDAMKRVLQEIGAYAVIAPGIVLLHAAPADGVNKKCFALITLSDPIKFGNAENDPVDLVFAFGATDKETHIQALKDLTDVISKPELVERIRAAENKEEIIDLLHRQIANS